MPMSKAAKQALKVEFAEQFKTVQAAIIAEYRGLTVAELTELRVKLRESKAEFHIVKNRVAKVAIKEDCPSLAPISAALKGPVGMILVYGDAAAAAKSALEFEKDKKDLFKITSGVLDGKAVSVAELKIIADLPSKDVLLARIIGTFVAPHRGLVTVLSGIPRQLVTVLAAIRDKKS